MMGNDLQGRIALITGASRRQGIGAAICRALAAEGAAIFFTCWHLYDQSIYGDAKEDEPERLMQELQALGARCASLEIDLSLPDAPARLLAEVEHTLGHPSILVNNAAYSTSDDYTTLTAHSLDAHYAVNVRCTLLLSVEFARRFAGSSGGRIINLTSGQSLGPMPGELAYVASKGAIDAFTVSLAAEVAGRGITVNAVDPGPTDNGWMSEKTRQYLLERSPMQRLGQPADAARLIAFLASDDAQWITGQIIHSNGGLR
jgi:3-oxoacyl-[acyl-carrier protein] reductase